MDNNADNINVYTKADFNINNVPNANAGINASDISVTYKKSGNNTNNISVNQSNMVGKDNKNR